MKKFMPILASTVALTAFSTATYAAQENTSGPYIGGDYGYVKVDGEDDFDDDNHMWQGVIGYRLNRFLALEGGYVDFGKYGSTLDNAETDGYTAALKVIFPLTQTVEFFAKAGQLWYTTDYTVASYKGRSDDEGVFAGAGVSFKVTDQLLFNTQYTWYDVDLNAEDVADNVDETHYNTDYKQASVGLEYRF